MTPTAVPGWDVCQCGCGIPLEDGERRPVSDPRLLRALRLLAVRAAQPADEGADRAMVRAAARTLRGC